MLPVDPENLDVSVLPSVSLEELALLPNISAIYFVLDDALILYIGRTNSLANRWMNHHRKTMYASLPRLRLAWIPVDRSLQNDLEKALIRHYQPRDNWADVPDNGYKNFILRLPIDLYKELEAAAADNDRSVPGQARYLIKQWLNTTRERRATVRV